MKWLYPAWGLLLVALVGLLMIAWVSAIAHDRAIASFRQHCGERGGHIYAPDIQLCLTVDGRLVEVYP